MPDVERRVLVDRAVRLRNPDRSHRGRVNHALDPRGLRLLEHQPGAAKIGVPDGGVVLRPEGGPPGDVEDALGPGHGAADRPAVRDVARSTLELEALERPQVGAPAREDPQFVAALGERANQVRADEPGGPRDERRPHQADRIRA